MSVIQCRAAVCWSPKTPISIEEIEVLPPQEHEVRIKLFYTGVCHTDSFGLQGSLKQQKYPCILGHEGCGVVESVGEGVTSVVEGDWVIPLYMAQCKNCALCLDDNINLCASVKGNAFSQITMPEGTTRFRCKGQDVYHFMGTSTFSQYTVLPEKSVAKIPCNIDPSRGCLFGCGVPTGFGAAVNTAKVKKDSVCAIWGLGTVGLSAILGCKFMGAKRIIGIDINPAKFEYAKKLGATECINPKDHQEPIEKVLHDLTVFGCDYTFEAVGSTITMKNAFDSCRPGNSTCTLIGVSAPGEVLSLSPWDFIVGKKLIGTAMGGYKGRDGVPKIVGQYLDGSIKEIDCIITHEMKLENVNEAFDLMHAGKSIKTVLKLHED